MSFIAGIHDPEAARSDVELRLDAQLQALRRAFGDGAASRYVADGFGLAVLDHGILDHGDPPVVSDDGRYALALDGEVFNSDALRRAHRIDPDLRMTTPQVILQLLTRGPDSVAAELNGQFNVVLYDRQRRRLTLIHDRFGFRPLFYLQRARTLVFSSTLGGLRAADPSLPTIDPLGTLELFSYGTHVFERSGIEGYRRLAPSTTMTIDENGTRSEKYWTYRYDESARALDQPTYFTSFAKLLDRAVERRMTGRRRIGIFLSGGYDSRAIAGAIRREHLPIPAFTFGLPESRDVRFGALLARRLDFNHQVLTSRRPYLYRYCASIVDRNEGLIPFVQNTSIAFHQTIKAQADVILTGFLGEYSGSHTWPALLRIRSRRKAIPAIFERMVGDRRDLCLRIFRRAFLEATFPHLRAEYESSFEELPNDHPLNLSDAWDFSYRHPWSYQAAVVDRPVFEVRAPQLDTELVEFLLSIPWHARLEQRVYKKMIAYSYPSIRDVPCTNSASPIDPRFAREYLKMSLRWVARKAWAPIRSAFGRQPPLGREIADLAEDFRAEPELRATYLDPLLAQGVFEPTIFDVDGIRALADEHFRGQARHEAVLSQLISWGLAHRSLIGGERVGTLVQAAPPAGEPQ